MKNRPLVYLFPRKTEINVKYGAVLYLCYQSFKKFYGRHDKIVDRYDLFVFNINSQCLSRLTIPRFVHSHFQVTSVVS